MVANDIMWFLPFVLVLRPLLGVQGGPPDQLLLALPVTVTFSVIRNNRVDRLFI